MLTRALMLCAIAFGSASLLLSPQLARGKAITLGSISAEPAAEVKKIAPFITYLAKQLLAEGIDQGKVIVARSIPEMASFLREGRVDLHIDSPFPAMAVSHLSGSKFLLRRWKKGIGEYRTVIFTRKDSGIARLEDLRGKIISFEEPFSTSGYFLPKVMLLQRGLHPTAQKGFSERVGSGEVGYRFSYADETTMVWVLKGIVAAGAMDNQSYLRQAGRDVEQLQVLHESNLVPRQIVSYRGDLSAPLLARIKDILLRMDQSEEGKKVLQDYEQTTRFDELSEQSRAVLLKLQPFLQGELEAE